MIQLSIEFEYPPSDFQMNDEKSGCVRTLRMRRFHLLLITLLLLPIIAPHAAVAQDKLLTIDDIYDPVKRVNFSGTPPLNLQWLKDGKSYLQSKTVQARSTAAVSSAQLLKVNAVTGAATPFFDSAKMEAALRAAGIDAENAKKLANRPFYELNPAQTAILLNYENDLYYYEFNADRAAAVRLTNSKDEETDEEFSPDGRMVAFVRNNNLYAVDLSTGRERQLTNDGSQNILNGRLDWVYEEELYGRGNTKGFWWSPDSKQIAYLRLDETSVHKFTVVDHIPPLQTIEDTPYPRAGDPNPLVKLGVVNVAAAAADNATTLWADTAKYKPEDFLIVRVAWSPDAKRVVYQAQNREQTFLDLNYLTPPSNQTTTIFRETSPAWVEVIDDPHWLKDGSFLWFSERSGWKHLYHYAPDGKLIRQVTNGKWEARTLNGVDEVNNWVYFSGTEHSHIAEQAYRIKLDGTGMIRLTQTEGTHRVDFNPTFTHYIDYWSDASNPTQVRLYRADGKLERAIDENKVDALKQYKLGRVEFLQVKTRDGFPMEAMMIRPPDFNPNKKYPVWSYTYSGPHAPSVRNSWGGATYMWHQMLAQKGYIIWICDNRTASGKGVESVWPAYKDFGELELRDLEDGLSYLKSQPFVDGARIGMWGWSFGGFMTSYALTHSGSFKIGIAGGSVTDWANYDSIYTERYMQTPQDNPEGYKRTAPVAAAAKLNSKLLLIHGAIDDNVHLQNTMQFAYELQKADKPFQLMLYPKARHGVTNPLQLKHMRQMMTDFILTNL
jgi:dipeptidyl-peptidase-4